MTRLRLQMLRPLSIEGSLIRRMSSGVAVSGERFKKAAKRLQLWMWLLCECFPSLRAFMSSIMLLAQRADNFFTHRQLLSWMRFKTPLSSQQVAPAAIDDLYPAYRSRR